MRQPIKKISPHPVPLLVLASILVSTAHGCTSSQKEESSDQPPAATDPATAPSAGTDKAPPAQDSAKTAAVTPAGAAPAVAPTKSGVKQLAHQKRQKRPHAVVAEKTPTKAELAPPLEVAASVAPAPVAPARIVETPAPSAGAAAQATVSAVPPPETAAVQDNALSRTPASPRNQATAEATPDPDASTSPFVAYRSALIALGVAAVGGAAGLAYRKNKAEA